MTGQTALIFGVTGQDGAYLARLLIEKGYNVHGTSRDAEMANRAGLISVGSADKVTLHSASPIDFRNVIKTIDDVAPDEIYNLSGQSSVGLSFEQPVETLESIVTGTLNILEAIRTLGKPVRFYNAASSECFGDTGSNQADERTPFHPCSPYAVAKAAAFWEVTTYRSGYGIHACSGILFNHESPLRPPRFVTRKIIAAAARIAAGSDETLTLGDLAVRRDWGWAPEYVEAMWAMLQQPRPEDYVIATGETHSLQEFVEAAFARVGRDWRDHVRIKPSLFRPSEIRQSHGCAAKAAEKLNWKAQTRMHQVVERMLQAEMAATSEPVTT